MPDEHIKLNLKLNGQIESWSFRRMPVEDSADLMSRLKSRYVMLESLIKEMEILERLDPKDRDVKEYFSIADKHGLCMKEVIMISKEMTQYVVEPKEDVVKEAVSKHLEEVLPIFIEYLTTMFPTEEEEKKS